MSDYIKREDAIKAVMNLTMYRGRVPIVNLKDIPSADVVPKDFHDKTCEAMAKRHTEEMQKHMWIPCSERLPEPEEIVLVTTIGMYPWAPNEKKVVISVMYGTEEHYIWGIPQSYVTVIAWMPLPEPYKEGE